MLVGFGVAQFGTPDMLQISEHGFSQHRDLVMLLRLSAVIVVPALAPRIARFPGRELALLLMGRGRRAVAGGVYGESLRR